MARQNSTATKVNPVRFQLSQQPDDPFALKSMPKWSPTRLAWTAQSRGLEAYSAWRSRKVSDLLTPSALAHYDPERGTVMDDTAVTSEQLAFLESAVMTATDVPGDVAEIGAYRGVTSAALAAKTSKTIYAIDPFIGYGGSETDYAIFRGRTEPVANIKHLRTTSGQAADQFGENSISLVFVDAVHDVSNSWFDAVTWAAKLSPGGFLALHDVDDHHGVSFTARRFIATQSQFTPWAYCPNILILRKNA